MTTQDIDILLIEDDPDDVQLLALAMKGSKLMVKMTVLEDGEKALAYLRHRPPYAGAPRPDVILLDLNLPKHSGFEILRELKDDPKLSGIPVVVLTVSDDDKDIVESYGLGASCFITKPVKMEQFQEVVKSIGQFWFTIVKLPPHRPR